LSNLNEYWLFALAVPAAITGWLLAIIAVRFVFRPLYPKKIIGITFHGIIPATKTQIAGRLGDAANSAIQSFGGFEQQLSDPALLKDIMPAIEEHIDDFLRNKLTKEMPVLSMFIGDKTIDSLKKTFLKEIELLLPKVMLQFATNLSNKFDVKSLIAQKINAIAPADLDRMMKKELDPAVRGIYLLGAATGFATGILMATFILLFS
jgi:uncharacterized membrane protein YheB (UPF0754 family)